MPNPPLAVDEKWPDSSVYCLQGDCVEGEDGAHEGRHDYDLDEVSGIVTDRVTNLLWQREVAGSAAPYQTAHGQCLALGGTWRVPRFVELLSVMDYGRSSYLPDPFNANGNPPGYWAEEVGSSDGGYLWHYYFMVGAYTGDIIASFIGGEATWGGPSAISPGPSRLALCVDGDPLASSFASVAGCSPPIIRDSTTGLEWQAEPAAAAMSWEAALAHCANDCTNGGGWRLASVKELGTIFSPTETRGVRSPFPGVGTGAGAQFWTSSRSRSDQLMVLMIDFAPIDAFHYPIRPAGHSSEEHRAWCVRSYDAAE